MIIAKMMKDGTPYRIRSLDREETGQMEEFLYQAIYLKDGQSPPPRSVIREPELRLYIEDFGTCEGDLCLAAEAEDEIVGMAWVRIMDDYGHVSDEMPSLAISLLKQYRGRGIGRELLLALLEVVRAAGYPGVSLSVQKDNYAARLYESVGFKTVQEKPEELIMVCPLDNGNSSRSFPSAVAAVNATDSMVSMPDAER